MMEIHWTTMLLGFLNFIILLGGTFICFKVMMYCLKRMK